MFMYSLPCLLKMYFGFTIHVYVAPWYVIQLLLLISGIHPNPGPSYKSLNICHVNIQSLYMRSNTQDPKFKIDDIEIQYCTMQKFDIICMSETWLTNDIVTNKLNINGYTLLRRDSGGRRGGVALYYNDDLVVNELNNVNPTHSEGMWISVKVGSNNVYLGVYYRPQNQSVDQITNFLDEFQESLDKVRNLNPDCIVILGDYNDPCKQWQSDHNKSELKLKLFDLSIRNHLKQIINESTFFTSHSNNILDLIFTDAPNFVEDSGVLPPIDSRSKVYHCAVFCTLNIRRSVDCAFTRRIWMYKNADYESLNMKYLNTNWTQILRYSENISDAVKKFTSIVLSSANIHIPNKVVTVRPKDKPWMSGYIRLLLRRRDRAYRKYRQTNTLYYMEKWHHERRIVNREIQLAKYNYKQKVETVLSDRSFCSKDFWKITKTVMGHKSECNIPTIIENDISYIILQNISLYNRPYKQEICLCFL